MTAVFKITDGTTEVNLIDDGFGFHINEWNQNITGYKGGGIYQDSQLADGRQLVFKRRVNGIETITLRASDTSQDNLIRDSQDLLRLLELSLDYWTMNNPQLSPVFLQVKATKETNTRFALIYGYTIPQLPGTHQQPFLQPSCLATFDEFDIVIERGPWLSLVPSTDEGFQISNLQPVIKSAEIATTGNNQTADYTVFTNTTSTANPISVGKDANAGIWGAMLFINLNIPQGATILNAYIATVSGTTNLTTDAFIKIFGEDTDDAANFSVNIQSRIINDRTTAFTEWKPENFTATATFNTSVITSIVQEIVDRTGWVPNNDMAFFFIDDDMAFSTQRDFRAHVAGAPRNTLFVSWVESTNRGRAATTTNEVYITNGYKTGQLTHIFSFDSSAAIFSSNLVNSTAYTLFQPFGDSNDIIYWGISQTTDNPLSTFSSLVFDLTAFVFTVPNFSADLQYFNGAWINFTQDNMRNNTSGSPSALLSTVSGSTTSFNLPFTNTGVSSVHIVQPSDWVTTSINGVTAYWIRVLVGAGVTVGIVQAAQRNRTVYTINQPWVELANDQILGDIKSINRSRIENQSGTQNKKAMQANRLILGVREVLTNDKFVSFLNCSNFQNGDGVIVTVGDDTTEGDVDPITTNGERSTFTATDTNNGSRIKYSITAGESYFGDFRIFFRAKLQTKAGSDFPKVNVSLSTGTGGIDFIGDQVSFDTTNDWQLMDLGKISIPTSSQFADDELPDQVMLDIQIQAATVGDVVRCYDVALIAVNNFAGDFQDKANDADSELGYRKYIEPDSTTQLRVPIRSTIKSTTTDNVKSIYQAIANSPFSLTPNKKLRVYFLAAAYFIVTGTDDSGGSGNASLSDSTADFINNGVKVGQIIQNETDGSEGEITNVTATTVTATLQGGSNNDWDDTDEYRIFTDNWISEPYVSHSIQLFKNQRYLTARGDR